MLSRGETRWFVSLRQACLDREDFPLSLAFPSPAMERGAPPVPRNAIEMPRRLTELRERFEHCKVQYVYTFALYMIYIRKLYG
jgi:hypothetical protein